MTRAFSKSPPAPDPTLLAKRDEWVRRVGLLVEQIRQWSTEAGWQVEIGSETIDEHRLGQYEAPAARVSLPKGDLPERAVFVVPIAMRIGGGADGRVDLEGYPTLSRVKLLGEPGDGWTIMTDSNVPLRQPWTAETFRQLAQDLAA